MSFEYVVHVSRDPVGEVPVAGVELLRCFTNAAYAFHYAQTLAMAYPEAYVAVQIEYHQD